MGKAGAPVVDSPTQTCDVFGADAVPGEVLIVEPVDATEHGGEELAVEAGVCVVCELAELVEGVAAAGDCGVDVMAAFAIMAAFVHWYEEPILAKSFDASYQAYRGAVPGWWPRLRLWRSDAQAS
jgi:hypothetical protein